MRWKQFILGLVVGFLCATAILFTPAIRYSYKMFGPQNRYMIKIDRITGKTWKLRVGDNRWRPVENVENANSSQKKKKSKKSDNDRLKEIMGAIEDGIPREFFRPKTLAAIRTIQSEKSGEDIQELIDAGFPEDFFKSNKARKNLQDFRFSKRKDKSLFSRFAEELSADIARGAERARKFLP